MVDRYYIDISDFLKEHFQDFTGEQLDIIENFGRLYEEPKKWISVDDKMPKNNKSCLVYIKEYMEYDVGVL